jgi:hypothetical protein
VFRSRGPIFSRKVKQGCYVRFGKQIIGFQRSYRSPPSLRA